LNFVENHISSKLLLSDAKFGVIISAELLRFEYGGFDLEVVLDLSIPQLLIDSFFRHAAYPSRKFHKNVFKIS